MIVIREDEKLRRRFPAKIKKYGDGTFYVTSNRLCFESNKHGMCFDLHFGHLWNWEVKNKKTVIIRWQEPKDGIEPKLADHKFSVDIEFKKKDGKRPEMFDVMSTMFYAFTDRYPYGPMGLGMYVNEKQETFNLFTCAKPKPMTVAAKDGLFDLIQAVQLGAIENATGETLLDQERFERFKMWDALQKDGEMSVYKKGGIKDPSKKDYTPTDIEVGGKISMVNLFTKKADELVEKITKWEKEGNKEELEKILPAIPTPENSRIIQLNIPARTVYENVKIYHAYAKIYQRVADILSPIKFDFMKQADRYAESILSKVNAKYNEGGDIGAYFPTAEKIPSASIKAKQEIVEYGKKLTETV